MLIKIGELAGVEFVFPQREFEVILEVFPDLEVQVPVDGFLFQIQIECRHEVSELVILELHFLEDFPDLGNGVAEEHAGEEHEENAVQLLVFVLGGDISVADGESSDGAPVEAGDVGLKGSFGSDVVVLEPVCIEIGRDFLQSDEVEDAAEEMAGVNDDENQFANVDQSGFGVS